MVLTRRGPETRTLTAAMSRVNDQLPVRASQPEPDRESLSLLDANRRGYSKEVERPASSRAAAQFDEGVERRWVDQPDGSRMLRSASRRSRREADEIGSSVTSQRVGIAAVLSWQIRDSSAARGTPTGVASPDSRTDNLHLRGCRAAARTTGRRLRRTRECDPLREVLHSPSREC